MTESAFLDPSRNPTQFYDDIAGYYDLIFEDWEASMKRQGDIIDRLVHAALGAERTTRALHVLDVSAGIGTQAIPLAQKGYVMTARDISAAAIHRLEREASARAIKIDCAVADMRYPPPNSRKDFEIVLSFDNSIPHLLSDEEILIALRAFLSELAPSGLFLCSVRDYAKVSRDPTSTHQYGERTRNGVRYRLRQEWSWITADHYDATMIIDTHASESWTEVVRTTMRYYAISVDRLLVLMREAGFESVRSDYGALYQPVVMGRRPLLIAAT